LKGHFPFIVTASGMRYINLIIESLTYTRFSATDDATLWLSKTQLTPGGLFFNYQFSIFSVSRIRREIRREIIQIIFKNFTNLICLI
jgi:hypothetical protein